MLYEMQFIRIKMQTAISMRAAQPEDQSNQQARVFCERKLVPSCAGRGQQLTGGGCFHGTRWLRSCDTNSAGQFGKDAFQKRVVSAQQQVLIVWL